MGYIEKLIEEIESEPCSQLCTDCYGSQTKPNFARKRFTIKYGEDAIEDTKFSIAEKEWHKANSPDYESFKVTFFDIGLTPTEAKDFYDLYLTQNAFEQCKCENGRELTEHGKRVARLHNALNNLYKL